jgi:uncharacterized protein (DUF433 family)
MSAQEFVRVDREIMGGTPCFAGTRVPVKSLWDYLEGNHTLEEFLLDFPTVTREQAKGVLKEAREKVIADAAAA